MGVAFLCHCWKNIKNNIVFELSTDIFLFLKEVDNIQLLDSKAT